MALTLLFSFLMASFSLTIKTGSFSLSLAFSNLSNCAGVSISFAFTSSPVAATTWSEGTVIFTS